MNNRILKILLTSSLALLLLVVISYAFSEATIIHPSPKLDDQEADDPFDKMVAVLTHKRCVNCHPSGDQPRQGEDSHIHNFGVRRGADNHGVPALRCESCHQNENNDYAGVPGAPEWSLAPKSMAWEGLSGEEIAKSMLDPQKNGGRNLRNRQTPH